MASEENVELETTIALQAIAIGLEAIAIRLEAVAIGLEAVATRLEYRCWVAGSLLG